MYAPRRARHARVLRPLFFALCLALAIASCTTAAPRTPRPQDPPVAPAGTADVRTRDGRIVIRPRLKYELVISLHVLQFAHDHHDSFVPWADAMRASLSPATLADAEQLLTHAHEWGLADLLADYSGGDDIKDISAYLRADTSGRGRAFAEAQSELCEALGVDATGFADWYADFLERYYTEAFAATWKVEHGPLVRADAARTLAALEAEANPVEVLEARTGRNLHGPGEVVLYPSSFSRPSHGYGFEEAGHPVALYRVGGDVVEVLGTIYHELLHPMVRAWTEASELRPLVSRLAASEAFRRDWEREGEGNYGYPDNWLDELFVHAISRYLLHRQGYLPREWVPTNSYCAYEDALYDALFAAYDEAGTFDAFAAHALVSIVETGDPQRPFAYLPGEAPVRPGG